MTIDEKVNNIFVKLGCQDTISNSDRLQEDLLLDSLAIVNLLLEIEETFGIELKEADLNPYDLRTVQNVIDLANKYCGLHDETIG